MADLTPDTFMAASKPPALDPDAYMRSLLPASQQLPNPHQAAQDATLQGRILAEAMTRPPAAAPAAPLPPAGLVTGDWREEQARPILRKYGEELLAGQHADEGLPFVTLGPEGRGAVQMGQGAKNLVTGGGEGRLRGASDIVRGGMEAATPAIPGAIAKAPLATLAGLGAGIGAQQISEPLLRKLGLSPGGAALSSDAIALLTGALAGGGAHKIEGAVDHYAGIGERITEAPANPDAFMSGLGKADAADARVDKIAAKRARTKPEVPQTGEPEQVSRVTDARERLAQKLTGKPWGEVSNSEGQAIDELIAKGYGMAVEPQTTQEKPNATQLQHTVDQQQAQGEAPGAKGASQEQRPGQAAPELVRSSNQATPQGAVKPNTASGSPGELPEKIAARKIGAMPEQNVTPPREPATRPAYGRDVTVKVPGEATEYKGRYAIREAADVYPSHNPISFAENPEYEHANERDYQDAGNAARVVHNSGPAFDPDYLTGENTTAEHGAPVIDPRGNALGGNNRTMTLKRVYEMNPEGAAAYRRQLAGRVAERGINPLELAHFRDPILVRELSNVDNPEAAIRDFNKKGAADLGPHEQAVADGKRLSSETAAAIADKLGEVGEDTTLAQALQGDNGAEILNRMVKDGAMTEQEAHGYLDAGKLTPEAKHRIAAALVGRLFPDARTLASTPPELRGKLERVAPQVLRLEGRPEWDVTPQLREGLAVLEDARAHGLKNFEDLVNQPDMEGKVRSYSPEALAVAKVLRNGPNAAAAAFRRFANDEALSRPGAPATMFEPPTRAEAFRDAFMGEKHPVVASEGERGSFSRKRKQPDERQRSLFDNPFTEEGPPAIGEPKPAPETTREPYAEEPDASDIAGAKQWEREQEEPTRKAREAQAIRSLEAARDKTFGETQRRYQEQIDKLKGRQPQAAARAPYDIERDMRAMRENIAAASPEEFGKLLEEGRAASKGLPSKVSDMLLREVTKLNKAYQDAHPETSQNRKPAPQPEKPAAPKPQPATPRPAREESQQERVRREWRENAARVSNNPEAASDRDIRRAIGFLGKERFYLIHRAKEEGRQIEPNIIAGYDNEVDWYKTILRKREEAAPPPQRAPEQIRKPFDVTAKEHDRLQAEARQAAAEQQRAGAELDAARKARGTATTAEDKQAASARIKQAEASYKAAAERAQTAERAPRELLDREFQHRVIEPQPQDEKAAGTKILERIAGKDGMEGVIAHTPNNGYVVTLHDADAGETFPEVKVFRGDLEAARAYARKIAGTQEGAPAPKPQPSTPAPYDPAHPEGILRQQDILREIQDPNLKRAQREAGEDAGRLAHQIDDAIAHGAPSGVIKGLRETLRNHLSEYFPEKFSKAAPAEPPADPFAVMRDLAVAHNDKLAKERAELQFNQPISREEQLRRLRRGDANREPSMFEEDNGGQQSGLFGEPPARSGPDVIGPLGGEGEHEVRLATPQDLQAGDRQSIAMEQVATAEHFGQWMRQVKGITDDHRITSEWLKPRGGLRREFESNVVRPYMRTLMGEKGAVNANVATLGLAKFIQDDVAPRAVQTAANITEAADDLLKLVAPAMRGGPLTEQAALIMRNRMAELARRSDQAAESVRAASRMFARQKYGDNIDFMQRMESGQKQKTPELDAIAKVLRQMLDGRRKDVQALGTGKLQSWIENYFPHMWKDPKRAADVFANIFGRRPLEGSKAFLKQRTVPTIADGLARGLEPVTDNPADMSILKIREMDRYIMAHRVLRDWKQAGLVKYIDAREGKAPAGWRQIADPIGTIYGPSIQQISEFPNEGLWNGLQSVANALGLQQERGFLALGNGVGRATRGGEVKTLHGTAEDVLAHEIGHQIDFRAGSGKQFVLEYPDAQTVARLKAARATIADTKGTTPAQRKAARLELKDLAGAIADRKEFAKQLRDLADLRSQGGGHSQAYVRSREEKMAQLAEMWVGSRELFQRTAPKVYARWQQFLDQNPKLHALRDIEGNTEVTPLSQPYDVGGLVTQGHYYAPEGAARILNNYLSPGLRQQSGAFRVALGANNFLNQMQLGLSAFHLGFTSADATVSRAALGYKALFHGRPIAAAKAFAETPVAAFTTALKGDKLLREWYKPGSQGGDIGKIVDGLVSGGGRAHMDEFYQTHVGEQMLAALRKGNVWGAAIRAPFAGTEALTNVIMREIVPRQKLGVFADLARFEMERLGPNATFDQTRGAMAKAWDSVENRMGQMTYDNLFWHRYAKDLAMLSTRSVGWNLGTLREIGGGLGDIIKQPINALQGKPVNLNRLSYLAGLVTVHATMAALYQYLKTGKGPDQLEDYFFPRNGETDEQGRPQRISLPTYVKDVYHYAAEPKRTIANKVSPLLNAFGEMIHNRDFYGTEIRHADDPLVSQLRDLAEYAGKQAIPFGIRNERREAALGASPETRAEQFVGITPAPSTLNSTPAERMARELAAERSAGDTRTKDQAARRDLKRELTRSLAMHRGIPDAVRQAFRDGRLTRADVATAQRSARMTPLQRSFNGLQLEQALKVYGAADAGERKSLRPMLARKAQLLKDQPPEARARMTEKLRAELSKR